MRRFAASAVIAALLLSSSFAQINPIDNGAVCGGTTDERAVIQYTIDTAPNGAIVNVTCPLGVGPNGFGVAIALTKSVIIQCSGGQSGFVPLSTITTENVIYVTRNPSLDPLATGFAIRDCLIGNPVTGTRRGGAAIAVDTTTTPNNFVRQLEVSGNVVLPSVTSGAFAFYHQNDATNNPNGGLFGLKFHDNWVWGGIALDLSGDSLWFSRNILTGDNDRFYVNQLNTSGSGNFVLDETNNVTYSGGLYIGAGYKPIVKAFFEQRYTSTALNGAVIDINNTFNATISAQIQVVPGVGNPVAIRDNGNGTVIDLSRVAVPAVYDPIVSGPSAVNQIIGLSNILDVAGTISRTGGFTGTKTVRNAGGTGDCTQVFAAGLLTGGTC